MLTENRNQILRHRAYISLFSFLLLAWGVTSTYGQIPNSGNNFNTPTLPQLPQITAQQPAQFEQININQYSQPNRQQNIYGNPQILNSPVEQQNKQIQQYERDLHNAQSREQQLSDIKKELQHDEMYQRYQNYLAATQSYRNSFEILKQFNPDSFFITKAIYLVENAYNKNTFSYDQFLNAIKQRADIVKQILKRENLNTNNNAALNYGIQKLFSQPNNFYNSKTKQTTTAQPLKYDFNDFMGDKD